MEVWINYLPFILFNLTTEIIKLFLCFTLLQNANFPFLINFNLFPHFRHLSAFKILNISSFSKSKRVSDSTTLNLESMSCLFSSIYLESTPLPLIPLVG